MNKHLEPVFKILLLKLDEAGIDYWVYGGIAVAAFVGEFIRINKDVDIFVKETDYQNTKSVLENICVENDYSLINCAPLKMTQRPKIDIIINKIERLSIVPIYLKENIVEFRFWKGIEEYPCDMLDRVERNVSGYRFFTPKDGYIKKLFINYLTSRKDKKYKDKLQIDAKAMLTNDEFSAIYS